MIASAALEKDILKVEAKDKSALLHEIVHEIGLNAVIAAAQETSLAFRIAETAQDRVNAILSRDPDRDRRITFGYALGVQRLAGRALDYLEVANCPLPQRQHDRLVKHGRRLGIEPVLV